MAFDDDPADTPVTTKGIAEIESFASLTENATHSSILIEDLSDLKISPGSYSIQVNVTDSHVLLTFNIEFIVSEFPEPHVQPEKEEVEKVFTPVLEKEEVEKVVFVPEFTFEKEVEREENNVFKQIDAPEAKIQFIRSMG